MENDKERIQELTLEVGKLQALIEKLTAENGKMQGHIRQDAQVISAQNKVILTQIQLDLVYSKLIAIVIQPGGESAGGEGPEGPDRA